MSDDMYQRFSDRFFQVSPLLTRPGWYVRVRGARVMGPFATREAAQLALFNLLGITPGASEDLVEKTETASGSFTADTRG